MGQFEMTVSTFPNTELNLKQDIELIKVGLLYSEKVTLKSIKADLVYKVLKYNKLTDTLEKMNYMKDIANLANQPKDSEEISKFIKQYHDFFKNSDDKNKGMIKLMAKNYLKEPFNEMEEKIFSMFDMNEIESLEKVRGSGKLDLMKYKTSIEELHKTDKFMYEYLESIEDTLSLHYNYPLFDAKISKMVRLALEEGYINITNGTQERMKHSNLTMTMLRSLPNFEKAKIDEIVDIRKDLDNYLIKFRSAIFKYTELIKADITDEDLNYEIDKLIQREINPIIQEIDEEGKRNSYLRELGYALINSKWVQTSAVGLMLGNVTDLISGSASVAPALLGTSKAAINKHKEWKDTKVRIEQNNLFFYYQTQEELRKL